MQRRFLTVIAVVLGGFAALAVLLAIRGSLIADFMREIAESRLSTALGQPVAIGQLGFSLTPRPAFTGSDIRVGDAAQQAPSVSLDRVEVFPVLRSFLQGPIHVTEVSLDGFTVSILRDAGGRWRAPAVFPAPTRGAGGGIGIDRVRVAGGRLLIFDVGANGALRERSRIDDMRTDLLVSSGGTASGAADGPCGRCRDQRPGGDRSAIGATRFLRARNSRCRFAGIIRAPRRLASSGASRRRTGSGFGERQDRPRDLAAQGKRNASRTRAHGRAAAPAATQRALRRRRNPAHVHADDVHD